MVNLSAIGLKILHNIVPFFEALGRVWRKCRRLARDILETGHWIGLLVIYFALLL
jgi:hypothetical protein